MVKMMINADQARKLAEERKTVELDRLLKAVEEAVIATSNIGGHACFVDIKNYDYNLNRKKKNLRGSMCRICRRICADNPPQCY